MNMKDGWWRTMDKYSSEELVEQYFGDCGDLSEKELNDLAVLVAKEWHMKEHVDQSGTSYFVFPPPPQYFIELGEEEMRRFKRDGAAKMARELLS